MQRYNCRFFYSYLFYISFQTAADIIFRATFHSTLSEKKILVTSFSFLTDSPKSLNPFNSQNLLKNMIKVFCLPMLPQTIGFLTISRKEQKLINLVEHRQKNLETIHKYFQANWMPEGMHIVNNYELNFPNWHWWAFQPANDRDQLDQILG